MIDENSFRQLEQAEERGHSMVPISPSGVLAPGVYAVCNNCGATLRNYIGRRGGEAHVTVCPNQDTSPVPQPEPEPQPQPEHVYTGATLNEWRDRVYQYAKDKGWWDDVPDEAPRTFGDMIALMHTELSEAYEEWRNGRAVNEVYYPDGKPEGVPIELMDTVIRILDFCGRYNIDVERYIAEKHEYNLTRAYRHGGKRV